MAKRVLGRRGQLCAALAASTLLLQACSGGDDERETAEIDDTTLAAALAGTEDLSAVSGLMGDAGLASIFDGVAAYTLLAPRDSAFEALGEAGAALRSEEQRPAMVAILRNHIVPGYLTPEDIANAIEQDDEGTVVMRTMAAETVTFTQQGDALVVTAEDGSSARFAGEAVRTRNGVAIPLDGLLHEVPIPEA